MAAKREFLVAYDYGMGGVWAFVSADTDEEILKRYPQLQVFNEIPKELDSETVKKLERCDLYAPTGWLALLEKQTN